MAHDYTGEVSPGGDPDRRTAGALEITKLAVDPQMHNNCYLLRCTDTGDQVLIDAADEPERLLELIGDGGLTTVITTHQHWDHHRACSSTTAPAARTCSPATACSRVASGTPRTIPTVSPS